MGKNKAPVKNKLRKDAGSGEKSGKSSHSPSFFRSREFKTIFGIFLFLFSILMAVAFVSFLKTWKGEEQIFEYGFWHAMFEADSSSNISGNFGGWVAYVFIKRWFGIASFLFIPVFILIGARLLEFTVNRFRFIITLLSLYVIYFSLLLGTVFTSGDLTILAGTIGVQTALFFKSIIGTVGLVLILIFGAILLISFTTPGFYMEMVERLKKIRRKKQLAETENELTVEAPEEEDEEAAEVKDAEALKFILKTKDEESTTGQSAETSAQTENHSAAGQTDEEKQKTSGSVPFEITNQGEVSEVGGESETEQEELTDYGSIDSLYDPRKELESYVFPGIDLLKEHGSGIINIDKAELEENKLKIESTLQNYGINIDKIFATVGPTVTLYEIVPAPGVRISKIKNLEDDIALSLSALGIRIIAPIPGKGTIGIEVPNKNPETVSFRSLVVSPDFQNTSFDLPIALGKTIDNKPYIADLSKMPHLLMAGATGQGKSVGLNTIIASLLYKKHPAELKFVLVDPKKVELPLFSKIERHYLAKLPDSEDAIITDTSQVVRTLKGLTIEMDQRYNLLKDAHVRNIKEYNEKFMSRRLNPNEGHKFLPYIVLIVDEFADLIMTAGKEVEGPIARIAQLARAVGIHLVIATQRPSVNIITGVIKANFPARMAFRVSAKVDSRTILDTSGADQLIGRGDMLLSNGSRLDRLQCAFIDTPELEDIAEFIGSQKAYPTAFELPEVIEEESDRNKDFDPDDRDPMFAEAARVIVQNQHGSTSLLQRKLKLGYNRAGRLIDQLEAAGIVGPFEGSKAREVLIRDMDTLEQLLNSYNN
jgi:DNA segregation ATPase FtsK/SpoIIIE, S-DNA-T family